MNDQKIFEYIAIKQPVRAVQLADKFDVALCDVSASLKSLVDVGDLVRSSGNAPNGQPAQFYSLSETFKKSREGKLVVARLEELAASAQAVQQLIAEQAAAPAPSAPPVSEAPAPAPTPLPAAPAAAPKAESPATAAGASRVELAIACIKERGSVPDADLRQVMSLRAGQYPSAWLTAAVKDGRVCKDGRNWTLGTGAAPAPLKKQPAFGGSLGLPGATPHVGSQHLTAEDHQTLGAAVVADIKAVVLGEPLQHRPASDVAPAPPIFRCGLWSDGVLELQRNGVTVAQLDEHEGATVAGFMARLQQPAAEVA